jgi:hypothetical protein
VVVGTAGAVKGKQQQKAAAQQQQQQQTAAQQQQMAELQAQQAELAQQQAVLAQQAAAAPGTMTDEKVAQLQKLGELKQAGILSEEEFAAEKAKILAS